jgi:SEC-C motif
MTFTASMPEPLTPQEIMGRNDPCWCRSGRKWKHCHRDRDKQHRRNINELLNAIGQEQARGYCVHPDAGKGTCSGGPTNAHTIQKEGGLRAIAENGHVISSKKGAFGIGRNKGEIIPVPDGVGNASTFPGFCNTHDAMFSPAEQKIVPLSQEVAFLLSYRAIAYEKFLKECALRSSQLHRQEVDKGQPFAEQVRIQQTLYAAQYQMELGLRDLTQSKGAFDAAYRASYSGFNFLVVEFSAVLPVVSCGAFFPDFDLFGQPLQSLAAATPLNPIAVNLIVLNDRSVLFLGWIGSGGPPEKFAVSYARLPQAEKANTAVRLAIEYGENTYGRPSWWTALPQAVRDGIVESLFTMKAPPVCQRGPDGLCLDGKIFATASVRRDGGNELR